MAKFNFIFINICLIFGTLSANFNEQSWSRGPYSGLGLGTMSLLGSSFYNFINPASLAGKTEALSLRAPFSSASDSSEGFRDNNFNLALQLMTAFERVPAATAIGFQYGSTLFQRGLSDPSGNFTIRDYAVVGGLAESFTIDEELSLKVGGAAFYTFRTQSDLSDLENFAKQKSSFNLRTGLILNYDSIPLLSASAQILEYSEESMNSFEAYELGLSIPLYVSGPSDALERGHSESESSLQALPYHSLWSFLLSFSKQEENTTIDIGLANQVYDELSAYLNYTFVRDGTWLNFGLGYFMNFSTFPDLSFDIQYLQSKGGDYVLSLNYPL